MTPIEKKLATMMLKKASEEFSNNICSNDNFDLVEDAGLTPEQSFDLRKRMRIWNGDDEEVEESPTRHYTHDWFLMAYLAAQFEDDL